MKAQPQTHSSPLIYVAIGIACLALAISFKKESSTAVSCEDVQDCAKRVPSSISESSPQPRDITCPEGEYLSGITSAQTAICKPLANVLPSSPAPHSQSVENRNQTLSFVGGWSIDKICSFNQNTPIKACEVPGYAHIQKCANNVNPKILTIDHKKVFIPVPCLRHGEQCYVESRQKDASTNQDRVFMSCLAYELFQVPSL